MATDAGTEKPTETRLNERYWNTDRTVDEIVEELHIGRNTLYASIQPIPAGGRCSACTGTLFYTNRTHRTAGLATCGTCAKETPVKTPEGESSEEARFDPASETRFEWLLGEIGSIDRRRVAVLGGAAAIGAMVGVAAVKNLRG